MTGSYREAEYALQVGQRFSDAVGSDGRIHTLSTLGVQRLLPALYQESPETLHALEENTVGALVSYDEVYGTHLFKTLKAYTECNGNISEAAELPPVHEHTVRHRLRRVTELTGFNATKFEDAAQIYLAVRAPELIQYSFNCVAGRSC